MIKPDYPTSAESPEQLDHTSSLVAMLRKIAIENGSIVERLRLMYDDGDTNSLDRAITQLAITVLRDTPEFQSNASVVHDKNAPEEKQQAAVANQRNAVNVMKRLIAQEAGIPDEAWLSELEAAKAEVKSRLDKASSEGKINYKDDILFVLGILEKDENGGAHFSYPKGLFPAFVDQQWYAYLESVAYHLEIESQVNSGLMEKIYLKEADQSRRLAHNTISRSVQQILGIETWTIEEARRLLAKMRDSRFPTIETSESARTAEDIAKGVGSSALIAVLELLNSRDNIVK